MICFFAHFTSSKTLFLLHNRFDGQFGVSCVLHFLTFLNLIAPIILLSLAKFVLIVTFDRYSGAQEEYELSKCRFEHEDEILWQGSMPYE